ncbi:barstar family protein [Nocardia arthritidis]|uniref:Barstar (barnase inhibitor) domain-containing protein n=1 Tax=Nocardia arthritidis TaxID=228602 RepID=A0A6G9Y7T8_9NOCA|nr:barstar family protein [Nocardia arthritidis]QIS09157.1 hypothetical protein F5544_06230 [Nocardia arthritidis]
MPISLSRFLARSVDTKAAAGEHNSPVLGALAVGAAELGAVRFGVPPDYLVRELRAAKMTTVAGVFDEFAAAFQFPYYFGANKDAFDECLRDLDEFVGTAAGYVAVVRDSARLLADAPGERGWFVDAMRDCADYWAAKGIAFRVVLQGESPLADVRLTN